MALSRRTPLRSRHHLLLMRINRWANIRANLQSKSNRAVKRKRYSNKGNEKKPVNSIVIEWNALGLFSMKQCAKYLSLQSYCYYFNFKWMGNLQTVSAQWERVLCAFCEIFEKFETGSQNVIDTKADKRRIPYVICFSLPLALFGARENLFLTFYRFRVLSA